MKVESVPRRVIRHDIIIEVPEDVGRRFRSVGDDAGEVDGGASVNMKIRRSVNTNMWN